MSAAVATAALLVAGPPADADGVAAPVPEHVERLVNGGFETGLGGWAPTTGTKLTLTSDAHLGAGAAVLKRATVGTAMLNDAPDTDGVVAGSTCSLSAWVKAPAGLAVRARLREFAADGTVRNESVGGASATGAWQRLEAAATTAGGTLDVTAWVLKLSTSQAFVVDDVSLACISPGVALADAFDRPDGLVTNEYATWNPTAPDRVVDPNWQVTSGSLFARGGAGWTGVPDGDAADAQSATATDSAVFRMHTVRQDFGAVDVAFRLRVDALTSTTRTPATAFDGVHIWLRHQSEEQLYAASVNRRDGAIVIKKKCAGGTTNGGTYYTLAARWSGNAIPVGQWQDVAAGAHDNPDGSVTLRLWRDGALVLETTDAGTGCAPLVGSGAVGIRGDNAEFDVDDVTVRQA